jgi:hypothetical protein
MPKHFPVGKRRRLSGKRWMSTHAFHCFYSRDHAEHTFGTSAIENKALFVTKVVDDRMGQIRSGCSRVIPKWLRIYLSGVQQTTQAWAAGFNPLEPEAQLARHGLGELRFWIIVAKAKVHKQTVAVAQGGQAARNKTRVDSAAEQKHRIMLLSDVHLKNGIGEPLCLVRLLFKVQRCRVSVLVQLRGPNQSSPAIPVAGDESPYSFPG